MDDLARVRQFIREEAARAGAEPPEIHDLVQAVDESVTNSIVHGYKGVPGPLEVELARDGRTIVVHLRDQAASFDPTTVSTPDVNLPLDQQQMGGLGVLLTRELTDSMSYKRTSRGNELTLTKKLQGGSDAEHHR